MSHFKTFFHECTLIRKWVFNELFEFDMLISFLWGNIGWRIIFHVYCILSLIDLTLLLWKAPFPQTLSFSSQGYIILVSEPRMTWGRAAYKLNPRTIFPNYSPHFSFIYFALVLWEAPPAIIPIRYHCIFLIHELRKCVAALCVPRIRNTIFIIGN